VAIAFTVSRDLWSDRLNASMNPEIKATLDQAQQPNQR